MAAVERGIAIGYGGVEPDFETDAEVSFLCPACGENGFHPAGLPVYYLRCSEPREECAVKHFSALRGESDE